MPGLPLFCLTRFSAACRFGRDNTRSSRSLAPKRPVSCVAGPASPLLAGLIADFIRDPTGELPQVWDI